MGTLTGGRWYNGAPVNEASLVTDQVMKIKKLKCRDFTHFTEWLALMLVCFCSHNNYLNALGSLVAFAESSNITTAVSDSSYQPLESLHLSDYDKCSQRLHKTNSLPSCATGSL